MCALGAHAQGPTSSDQTLAQTLFDAAVKLMDQGRWSDACPKLAESQRLDPGGGTLLNIGFCRQNEGKLASAWEAYNEALSQAIKDGRKDREATARVHVDELEGKVAKLVIDVSDGAKHIDQIEIRIDGSAVRQAAWGVLSPIDRGEHAIVVTAPRKIEFKTSVNVTADGSVQHVSIPALEDAPVVEAPDRGGERHGWAGQAALGWVMGGVGLASIGVGVATGILAIDYRHQSDQKCPSNQCTVQGVSLNEQAKTYAWVTDFTVGIGAVALVTGFVLVLTAPRSPRAVSARLAESVRLVPVMTPQGAGMAFVGRF